MRIRKGNFHLNEDGKYYVHYRNPEVGEGVEKFVLCEDDQYDRKLYLKESMSMEGEEVEFEIHKRFLAGKTEYFARLIWTEEKYSLEDVLQAAKYGYEYREKTAHPDFFRCHHRQYFLSNLLKNHKENQTPPPHIPLTWQKYKQL